MHKGKAPVQRSTHSKNFIHIGDLSGIQADTKTGVQMPDLLGGEDEKPLNNAPMAPNFQQGGQTQVKEFEVVVEETMRRFASGLKLVLEGFGRYTLKGSCPPAATMLPQPPHVCSFLKLASVFCPFEYWGSQNMPHSDCH